MRRTATAVGVAIVVLTISAGADEKPPAGYQQAMRDNAQAMQIVRQAAKEIEDSGAGAQDYMPFEQATGTMKTSFAATLEFWQGKKLDDAVKLAEAGAKQVADLEAAAKDRDYREVLDAIVALNQTCAACHAAHRSRLPDGTFEIK
jgi:hypothetical protein